MLFSSLRTLVFSERRVVPDLILTIYYIHFSNRSCRIEECYSNYSLDLSSISCIVVSSKDLVTTGEGEVGMVVD